MEALRWWPAGTAWSPIRGVVGPGAVDVAGNQAGVEPSLGAGAGLGAVRGEWAGHGTLVAW